MNFEKMEVAELETRKATILNEIDAVADVTEARALKEEMGAIISELETRKEKAEQEKEMREAVANGEGEIRENFIERKSNEMEIELRNTPEYGKAFCNMVMTGKDEELRALLSANGGGSVMVPTQLENEIRNAWENCELASLVKRTYYKGNVKVGFEVSATGATVHTEGTEAPDEEALTWGSVELKAESIKKWITISDEAIDGTTIDTLGEIYKEIAQKIAEKAEELIIAKINAMPQVTSATAPAVAKYTGTTLAIDTVTMALAELSGKARNITLVMNRRTKASLVSLMKNNKFAVDPFDGCRIVFTDALPAYSTASSGQAYIIAGDFGYGFQMNFPNGSEMTIKTDDLSLSEQDLVKVVGRQYVGMGVVAPKAFVKIVK